MATIDEILRAHDDGVITVDELFGHLLGLLALVPPEMIRGRLRAETGREEAFEEWVEAVSCGAEMVSAGRSARLSEQERAAIARYREHTRVARYARLADQMKQWMAEPHGAELRFDPDAIAPFLSSNIERLLGEAVPT